MENISAVTESLSLRALVILDNKFYYFEGVPERIKIGSAIRKATMFGQIDQYRDLPIETDNDNPYNIELL